MKQVKYWFVTVVACLLVAASAFVLSPPASAVPDSSGTAVADPPATIKPALGAKLEAQGKADFWVRLDATADLTKASQIQDWDKRGEAVVAALKATAKESQSGVLAQLDAADVDYETFWATNAVYVEDGSQELAESLTGVAGVSQLWPSRTYGKVEPIKQTDANSPQSVEWGLSNINADDVWAQGDTGQKIVIASIDSGVQYDHPALVNSYRGNNGDGTFTHDYNWFDTSNHCPNNAPCDTVGHGTHTMGTMIGSDGGANQIGVAPGAKWITANGCATCSDADLTEAGQWMLAPTKLDGTAPDASMRPNVINNSWGSEVASNDPFMEDISKAWTASGIFGVWSNGNNGPSCASSGSPGSRTVNYSVGAYDASNKIASFSSRGAGQGGTIKPDISAPGVAVRSSLPGSTYGIADGTSMAAPHVTGAVALLWSAEPDLVGDIDATRQLLDETAIDTDDEQCGGTAENNNVYGEGRLDALALVKAGDQGPMGTLSGTVTDGADSKAIGSAKVRVVGGDIDKTLSVSATGDYQLKLPVGDYRATASAFGYGTDTATVTVTEEATVDHDFSLVATEAATVTGQVTDGSGHGWPLYAKITVADMPDGSFYTDPHTGRYSIKLPAGASYDLTIAPVYPGYQNITRTVDVAADGATLDVPVPVDIAACKAFGYEASYSGTFADFNDGKLPAGWSIVDHIKTGGVWRFDDPFQRTNKTGGGGAFVMIDSDYYDWGNSQDTSLVTPTMDLSGYDAPSIGFNQDFHIYKTPIADVDLSLDGGATWTNVLRQTADVRGPRLTTIPIPQAAGQSNVKVRFHYYKAEFDWFWQLDNVYVGDRFCKPTIQGGYLVGNVRDANTGDGVVGATVQMGEQSKQTVATPDDPGLDDGFYWMFSKELGAQEATASARSYVGDTQSFDLDGVTKQDFSLKAGRLAVTPGGLDSTLVLGDRTATRTFTVKNDGTAPAKVTFGEGTAGFTMQKADGDTESLRAIRNAPGARSLRVKAPVSMAAAGEPTAAPTDAVPSADPWTNIADYPQKIMDNRVVTVGGKVYSIGGGDGTGPSAQVWAYDPSTLNWSPVASLPGARNAMTVGVVSGQIVASSGWATGGPSPSTWTYDPETDTWKAGADNPTPRAAAGQAVLGGKLYAVGGCTTSSCTPTSNSVAAYDPAADTWQRLADYPLSVAFAECGAAAGQVICTGGNDGTTVSDHTYAYDPDEDEWTQLPDAPTDTWGASYAVANGQLIVVGGVQAGAISNAAFAYDPATRAWTSLPNANTASYRGGAACGFYRVGGATGGYGAVPTGELLPGFDQCTGDAADVDWLSLDRSTATLAPGDSVTVRVTMHAQVEQPGTYRSAVWIQDGTPYPKSPMPVTMTVTPPSSWSKLSGVVQGVDCRGAKAPLNAATVAVNGSALALTFVTKADGSYAYWMDRRNSPLTVIASKDGYRTNGVTVKLKGGQAATVDFDLVKVGC